MRGGECSNTRYSLPSPYLDSVSHLLLWLPSLCYAWPPSTGLLRNTFKRRNQPIMIIMHSKLSLRSWKLWRKSYHLTRRIRYKRKAVYWRRIACVHMNTHRRITRCRTKIWTPITYIWTKYKRVHRSYWVQLTNLSPQLSKTEGTRELHRIIASKLMIWPEMLMKNKLEAKMMMIETDKRPAETNVINLLQ